MYTLPQAIIFMLVGRLSDILGRRWFFIIGSVFGLAGSIIGATATSVPQLIAAETLIGIGTGFQNSFFWVVSEIVPMKRRFIANAGLFAFTIPTVSLSTSTYSHSTLLSTIYRTLLVLKSHISCRHKPVSNGEGHSTF